MTAKPLNIILTDDDADDQLFFQDALTEINAPVSFKTLSNGDELMNHLLQEETVLPDILFLDHNMPLKTGMQCLEEIRNHKKLENLFVIIYSTSFSDEEVDNFYHKKANLFINKPNGFTELKKVLTKALTLDIPKYTSTGSRHNFVLSFEN